MGVNICRTICWGHHSNTFCMQIPKVGLLFQSTLPYANSFSLHLVETKNYASMSQQVNWCYLHRCDISVPSRRIHRILCLEPIMYASYLALYYMYMLFTKCFSTLVVEMFRSNSYHSMTSSPFADLRLRRFFVRGICNTLDSCLLYLIVWLINIIFG